MSSVSLWNTSDSSAPPQEEATDNRQCKNDPTQQIPITSLKELYAIKPNCAVFTSMSDSFLEPDMTLDESATDSAPEEPGQAIPEPLTSLFDPTSFD